MTDQIDGAKILSYNNINFGNIRTGATLHVGISNDNIKILAIGKYDEDPGYYLFYCDNNLNVLNDTYHNTIDEAKEQAEFEFTNSNKTWINK